MSQQQAPAYRPTWRGEQAQKARDKQIKALVEQLKQELKEKNHV